MRFITGLFALLGVLLLMAAADEKDKEPDPTFRPGAEVTIELTVRAPKGWQVNHLLPLQVIFDAKQLKDAPFTVEETTLTFELEDYADETTISIPLKLSKDVGPGRLTVPFDLDHSVCNKETLKCTFALQDVAVAVTVEQSAPENSKNRALAVGSLPATLQLMPAAP
jgi:hypothetical protein